MQLFSVPYSFFVFRCSRRRLSRCQPCSRGAQVPACLTVTHMVLSLLSSDPQPTPSLGADMTPHPLGFGTHTVAYPLWGELKDNVESSCGRPQDIVKLGSDGEGLWSNWRRNTDTRTCCPQAGGLAGKHVPDTLSTFSPMSRFCPPPSPSPAPESNLVMPSQRVRLLGCSARRGRAENGPGREGKWRHPPFPSHSTAQQGTHPGPWRQHTAAGLAEPRNDFPRARLKCQLWGSALRDGCPPPWCSVFPKAESSVRRSVPTGRAHGPRRRRVVLPVPQPGRLRRV